MILQDISQWFQVLRSAIMNNHFSSEGNIPEDDFKVMTNLNKNNFRNLYTLCNNVLLYDKNIIVKKAFLTFLVKLKYDLSDDLQKIVMFHPETC